jgi:hypothetical protein
VKVVIAGMAYEYDGQRAPMSEALAIEDVYKRRYAEWQSDLAAGSAKAMCVLAWIILRRDGTEVPFEDIIDGKFDFDLAEMLTSLAESAEAAVRSMKSCPTRYDLCRISRSACEIGSLQTRQWASWDSVLIV